MSEHEVKMLQAELTHTRTALKTLIAWMVQSANSPINRNEAMQLIRMADGDDK